MTLSGLTMCKLAIVYSCVCKNNSHDGVADSPASQARHYKSLQALWRKPNANKESVTQLLDLEFEARRAFIDSDVVKQDERHVKIMEAYPCFREIEHVSHYCINTTLLKRRFKLNDNKNTDFRYT